jgi:pimeloyl-ACP methyl ester carboxylesterase
MPPLVFLHRFRGTLDHWDPAFLEALAAHRRVLTFDSVGVGRTRGTVPNTVQGITNAAADFVHAMGLDESSKERGRQSLARLETRLQTSKASGTSDWSRAQVRRASHPDLNLGGKSTGAR